MVRWCFVLATLALSLGACSSDEDHREHKHYGGRTLDCSENVTCGTCTPVLGCGWCQFEDGSGRCVSGPSRCGETFRFNWNPEDCPATPVPSDAGPTDAGPTDAGPTDTGSTEAAPTDAPVSSSDAEPEVPVDDASSDATDAPTEEVASDTGSSTCTTGTIPSGCAQSFGGTLCGTSQYTVGCLGTARPEGCVAKLTEGSTTHYCCACK